MFIAEHVQEKDICCGISKWKLALRKHVLQLHICGSQFVNCFLYRWVFCYIFLLIYLFISFHFLGLGHVLVFTLTCERKLVGGNPWIPVLFCLLEKQTTLGATCLPPLLVDRCVFSVSDGFFSDFTLFIGLKFRWRCKFI